VGASSGSGHGGAGAASPGSASSGSASSGSASSGSGTSGSGWFGGGDGDGDGDGDGASSASPKDGAGERRRRQGDPNWETFRVSGDRLVETVKRIVREGNARRIVIRNDEDRVLLEFPLTAGVVGAALLPMWAAIGAVAALVGNCSIEVERKGES
jgi:hypothetical protein